MLLFIVCVMYVGCASSSQPKEYFSATAYEHIGGREPNDAEYKFLDSLGLMKRPKRMHKFPSLRNSASKFLLSAYNEFNEDDRHVKHRFSRSIDGNIITPEDRKAMTRSNNIVTFSSRQGKGIVSTGKELALSFNLKGIPTDFKLSTGTLRFFQGGSFQYSSAEYSIFLMVEESQNGLPSFQVLSDVSTIGSADGWLEMNVTSALSKWLAKGVTIQEMSIVVKPTQLDQLVYPQDIGLVDAFGEEQYQPFMIGYFNGPEKPSEFLFPGHKKNRPKRDINKRMRLPPPDSFKMPKTCQRMNFTVDFKELRMDSWIIAPKNLDAYFCSGECNFPLGPKMNATNHAIVQTLMHLKNPTVAKPCCIPTSLASISILHYINEDNVNMRKFHQIIAKSCGCH